MKLLITSEDLRAAPRLIERIGGKAAALARLQRAGLPVPAWVALTPEACSARMTAELSAPAARLGQGRQALELREPGLDPSIVAELDQAIAQLCSQDQLVAVRSSALEEDGAQHSFAGQFESYLDVEPGAVAQAVVAVWRSGFHERVLAYRQARGLPSQAQPPAVLIQRMLRAERSGVAFSAHPVSGRRGSVLVAAVCGLGAGLVGGQLDADSYEIDREGMIMRRLATQEAREAVLSDEQVRAIVELALQAERCFGQPQDVEWAMEAGQLYILQSRPITNLAALADPDGVISLWDNSNIVESYGGITTPLTFSFARRAYEQVYRQFCRMMGVPQVVINERSDLFGRMLGLIRGRLYYNLLSWYKILALLPGFSFNRRFMEQMMGVSQELSASQVDSVAASSSGARLRDGLRLLRTSLGLVLNYWRLPRQIEGFYARVNHALGTRPPDLQRLRADELVACCRRLERQLLTRWDAPIVNDFFAMIFYGVLRQLSRRWCADEHGTLHHALLCAGNRIVSAEPAARMSQLAQLAAQDPAFVACLSSASSQDIEQAIAGLPELQSLYSSYLERFGERCLEELKLESLTLYDDPLPLLRAIGQRASQGAYQAAQTSGAEVYQQAQAQVAGALKGRPLRRMLFRWVLKQARQRLQDRENLRFERTRVFGRARRIFLELGRRFYGLDLLGDPRDICYLEVDEVLGFVEGTATSTDLKGLVALRQAVFERYRGEEAPGSRFKTSGIVYQGNLFQAQQPEVALSASEQERKGTGCSPGLARGRVRVVRDPRNAILPAGAILVAEYTDPGWIMLFPSAAGLIVERGSVLSHSAIVARELGLPAVIALPEATRWLNDGDWVEIDGSTGVVCKR